MQIQENVSLKDKNWFQTGGDAKYFAEPETSEQFVEALNFARENGLEIFVLGEGANILISDDGFDGLVIRPRLKNIEILGNGKDENEKFVKAGAGVQIQELIDFCLENNLIGLQEFSGIPGNVGGAVFINIHFFNFLLEQFLTKATVINRKTGEMEEVENEWFEFGYDKSKLQKGNYYLVDATFKLQVADDLETAYQKGRRDEIVRYRNSRYPTSNTCGSFFRNFHDDEVTIESNGQKMIFVAYYLDKIGIKGELQVGDAKVSFQHANMIVNGGNATSSDIINLARKMQELVRDEFGIIPQPECQLIGFREYPLY